MSHAFSPLLHAPLILVMQRIVTTQEAAHLITDKTQGQSEWDQELGITFQGYPHSDILSPTRLNLLMFLPPPKIMLQSGDQSAHMILGGHFISKTYHVGES